MNEDTMVDLIRQYIYKNTGKTMTIKIGAAPILTFGTDLRLVTYDDGVTVKTLHIPVAVRAFFDANNLR